MDLREFVVNVDPQEQEAGMALKDHLDRVDQVAERDRLVKQDWHLSILCFIKLFYSYT